MKGQSIVGALSKILSVFAHVNEKGLLRPGVVRRLESSLYILLLNHVGVQWQ